MSLQEKFLRLPQVMEVTGVKKSYIWQSIKDGTFPKQIKISARISVWKESDINNWILKQID